MSTKTAVTVKEIKDDSALVFVKDNQVLTSSLDVARYFEKEHANVIKRIRELQEQMALQSQSLKVTDANPVFIETTYQAESGGRNYPLYYLNRDAFTVLTMGFTGRIALQFKLSYIAAFNRMEAELRNQQQNKPMSALEMWKLQLQVAEEHEQRLNSLEGTVHQQDTDIKNLREAHNGMSLRHEGKLLQQQKQLDHHEEEISDIKQTIATRSPRSDIRIFIDDMVKKYKDTEYSMDYGHAYACFYQELRKSVGFELGKEQEVLKAKRLKEGWSQTRADNVSKHDTIDDHPEIWPDIRSLISRLRADYDI